MQKVPISWYKTLNYVLGVGQLFLIGTYYWLVNRGPINPDDLGINFAAAVLAIIGSAFAFTVFPLLQLKKPSPLWGTTSYVLTTITVVFIIMNSGDYQSPLYFMWISVLAITAMFGTAMIGAYFTMSTLYFALVVSGGFTSTTTVGRAGLLLGINYVVLGLSYMFWRHHYLKGNETESLLTNRLAAEQLRSEVLINSINDGIIAVDPDGKIQLFNPAASKITQWSNEDAVGIDVPAVIKLVRVEKEKQINLDGIDHPFMQSINTGRPVNDETSVLVDQKGQNIEISLSISPVLVNDKAKGAVGILRDVTEQRKHERQRDDFISTASHEMRTPVAAIEGYLALALNEKVAKIDDKARNYINKAHESVKHLGQLFKDLLTAAKSEDGRITNHPVVIELNEFLKKVTDDARFTANNKGLELKFAVASNEKGSTPRLNPLFYVHADEERLREVLTNLIVNAIKFTQEGSVTVGLRGADDFVQMSVADTGIGIEPSDVPHLFQKFYRIDNSATRTIGGTGLGLFIAKNIVELYNGRIWVESEVGKGSTFYINLPRLSAEKARDLKQKELATLEILETDPERASTTAPNTFNSLNKPATQTTIKPESQATNV